MLSKITFVLISSYENTSILYSINERNKWKQAHKYQRHLNVVCTIITLHLNLEMHVYGFHICALHRPIFINFQFIMWNLVTLRTIWLAKPGEHKFPLAAFGVLRLTKLGSTFEVYAFFIYVSEVVWECTHVTTSCCDFWTSITN